MWLRWRKPEVANDVAVEDDMSLEELRKTERRRIFREASLYLPEGGRMTALAMDISPLGTRIRLLQTCRLPDELEVTVLDEVKRERAKIVWRDGKDVGLEFLNPDLGSEAYIEALSEFAF